MTAAGGWIGVDLDGTLAEYHGWQGPRHIGEPVPRMVERVLGWLHEGRDVRIVTARANPEGIVEGDPRERQAAHAQVIADIEAWCEAHLGQKLPITYSKDFGMVELWDDRVVAVVPNTGVRIGAPR